MGGCDRRLHGAKEAIFCNEDEYENYERECIMCYWNRKEKYWKA